MKHQLLDYDFIDHDLTISNEYDEFLNFLANSSLINFSRPSM